VKIPYISFMGNKTKLTARQKEFAKHYVEGIYSARQCAIKSGYSEDSAKFHASRMLNGKHFPLVTEYIKELRDERERRYGVTLIGQLKRLSELSHKAEEEGQFSASINAEKTRSALGGLTVDRREQNHIHQLDKLSREEIVARLNQIRSEYPHAFIDGNFKKVEDVREEPLVAIEEKPTSKNTLSEN
jgi:phage terminase small subunit